jgi:hypothetical protein
MAVQADGGTTTDETLQSHRQLNIHFHCLVQFGVYGRGPAGEPTLVRVRAQSITGCAR